LYIVAWVGAKSRGGNDLKWVGGSRQDNGKQIVRVKCHGANQFLQFRICQNGCRFDDHLLGGICRPADVGAGDKHQYQSTLQPRC